MSRLIAIAAIVCLLLAVAGPAPARAADPNVPYHCYYPSQRGPGFMRLVHNVFGFSIELPADWIFGANFVGGFPVAFLYPKSVDISKVEPGLEMIDITRLPIIGGDLDEVRGNTMRGRRVVHKDLTMVSEPRRFTLNGLEALSWDFRWTSRRGHTVNESMTLVQSPSGIRSISVKVIRDDFASRRKLYDEILGTFQPFEPKQR